MAERASLENPFSRDNGTRENPQNTVWIQGKRTDELLLAFTQETPRLPVDSTTLFTTLIRRPLILNGHDRSATG